MSEIEREITQTIPMPCKKCGNLFFMPFGCVKEDRLILICPRCGLTVSLGKPTIRIGLCEKIISAKEGLKP